MDRKLLHELLDAVMDLQDAGDFVSLDIENYGSSARLYHTCGGLKSSGFDKVIYVSEKDTLEDAIKYCRTALKEKDPRDGHPQSQ